jgi:AraC-like DNA-binding protein
MWNYDTADLQRWLLSLPKPIGIFACDDNQAEILLEQRFKEVTGASIYTVISNLRMDYFAQQLVSFSDTVSEIAARMYEPDTKSISRRFRALKGCTPTEYRKQDLRKLGV